jgi:predicted permease
MKRINEIRRRLVCLLRRRQMERELEDEMRFHLELKQQHYRERGLQPEEAHAAAVRQFGNLTLLREDSREAWSWAALEHLAADLRIAARVLRKDRSFVVLAVLTLGLGIGVTTAVFSLMHGILFTPLPYFEPQRLAALTHDGRPVSPVNLEDWRSSSRSFRGLAAETIPLNLTLEEPAPDSVPARGVDRGLFQVLGVQAARGRLFMEEEFDSRGPAVCLLTWSAWHRRFGAAPDIIGRTLAFKGRSRIVVGVLPADFREPYPQNGISEPEIWLPMDFSQMRSRAATVFIGIGRLAEGVSLDQARAEMESIDRGLRRQYPENPAVEMSVIPLMQVATGPVRKPLWLLLGAVMVLLLAACVNLANLMLARAIERQREFAIRAALGGRRGLFIRQVLLEGLLLSGAGALCGLALAHTVLQGISFTAAAWIPRIEQVRLGAPVLLFTIGMAMATGVLFAIVPALVASRGEARDANRGGAVAAGRMRHLFLAAEVVLCVALMACAGLLLRSFTRILHIELGYDSQHVLSGELSLSTGPQSSIFLDNLLARIRRFPGVEAAGASGSLPLAMNPTPELSVEIVGRAAIETRPSAEVLAATPDYFPALRIALRSGRLFDDRDAANSPPVALVNESFVRHYLAGQDPLGRALLIGEGTRNFASGEAVIVGVVADVRQTDLLSPAKPQVWRPHAQCTWPSMMLAIRGSGDPDRLGEMVRAELRSMDRRIPLTRIRRAHLYRDDLLAQRRLSLFLLAVLAGLALVLSAVGIYGVIAYSVSRRQREIGIRMALGARPGDVISLIVGQEMKAVLGGLAAGTVVALIAARLLAGMLYGVGAQDPLTFTVILAMFTVVALAASYWPSRRAANVNPVVALRSE